MQNSVGQQYTITQPQVNVPQQNPICGCPLQQGNMPPQQAAQPAMQQPVQQFAQQPYMTPPPQGAGNPNEINGTQISTAPGASGVTIQIFNPSVGTPGAAPTYNVNQPMYYPPGYYTGQWQGANGNGGNGNGGNGDGSSSSSSSSSSSTSTGTKKEKRDIVLLTDSYIKNLENYLNSQDKTIRMQGAKEVAARLEEDSSRRDDKALNALVNKMIQDPHQPIRALGLALLSARKVTGDEYTVSVLKNMRDSQAGYGQDSVMANDILLKMSGQIVQKEFEVNESSKKKKAKDD